MTTIEINGVHCPMVITPRVLNVWMMKHKIGFEQMGSMTMDQQGDLIWMGVERGCRDTQIEITEQDFQNAMDSEHGFSIMGVFQTYMEKLMAKMTGDPGDEQSGDSGN